MCHRAGSAALAKAGVDGSDAGDNGDDKDDGDRGLSQLAGPENLPQPWKNLPRASSAYTAAS